MAKISSESTCAFLHGSPDASCLERDVSAEGHVQGRLPCVLGHAWMRRIVSGDGLRYVVAGRTSQRDPWKQRTGDSDLPHLCRWRREETDGRNQAAAGATEDGVVT